MNCLYSFRTGSYVMSPKNWCKNHDYCHIIMPKEDYNNLKYNQDKEFLYLQRH